MCDNAKSDAVKNIAEKSQQYATQVNQSNIAYGSKAEYSSADALNEFQISELKAKIADIKRFLQRAFPFENRDLAMFKLDEAEMWALKSIERKR